jgi:hypothetical protein
LRDFNQALEGCFGGAKDILFRDTLG